MSPPLWVLLETLFGAVVYLYRCKIFRAAEFFFAPPPLETEELPKSDSLAIFFSPFVGAGSIIGPLIISAITSNDRPPPTAMLTGIVLGLCFGYRKTIRQLAPNQPWRVLTETLAARAGMNGVTVRMARSKSLRVRASHRGVVTLPSALLRDAAPDELAFHIGRALWEIQSALSKSSAYRFAFWLLYRMTAILLLGAGLVLNAPEEADRFALNLTGDLSAALQAIEAETAKCGADMADMSERLRVRQVGQARAESLSAWWAARQNAPAAAIATTPGAAVQSVGRI